MADAVVTVAELAVEGKNLTQSFFSTREHSNKRGGFGARGGRGGDRGGRGGGRGGPRGAFGKPSGTRTTF